MALRFDTLLAAGSSAFWNPTGQTILQMDAANPEAVVSIYAKVEPLSPWAKIEEIRASKQRFTILPKFNALKLDIARNIGGGSIKVWDNE